MWKDQANRLLLLELLTEGTVRRRGQQSEAFDALAVLPWTRATGRRDEIALVADRRSDLIAMLERAWSDWRAVGEELGERGLKPTPEGWRDLQNARRAEQLPVLPARINRRTAAALAGAHSKIPLSGPALEMLGDTETTHDGIVRLRPPAGLAARTAGGALDLVAVARVLGEAAIPERAFRNGFRFEGRPRAVLLVENLGPWRDLPELAGWLFAHVPGWDTATAVQFLDHVDPEVPVFHFGDLDPDGLGIFRHLRARCPRLRWFVPDFWATLLEIRGLPTVWPDRLELGDAPALVRELAGRGLWLEQEPLAVDPRLADALNAMLESDAPEPVAD